MTNTIPLKRIGAIAALTLALSGCAYNIRLDPGADDAQVAVNGEPVGRGQVTHPVGSEYGWPASFEVRVTPKTGTPYTVEIARELDTPRAVIQTAVDAGVALAFLVGDLQARQTPVASLIMLAYAPFAWLNSYHYKAYYDLVQEKRKQEAAAKQPGS